MHFQVIILNVILYPAGMRKEYPLTLSSRLRHHATTRKVVCSIPDDVTGFFNLPNPRRRITALGFMQPDRNTCQESFISEMAAGA